MAKAVDLRRQMFLSGMLCCLSEAFFYFSFKQITGFFKFR
ncbi:hypothetical protein HM1_0257 [Heliomicrobium modesticaldum Ice1]|uniref:Uncharacterized protein n=1 Tax=Heliobacterium modesticaldum (strain ATCC 51547 / Ice1) TaxID=498761 RepID=B0TEF7_HELMI|nr:hypothetical protein HM1_0257 [Heliomicrobium modesticaldum Ice1]